MNNIGQRVQIDQIIIHPNYTGDVTQGFDLALIHLSSPLCFNENVQFISYATPNNTMPQDIAPNKKVFISGWGYTSPGSGASNVLMGADLTIINNFDANDLLDDPSNGCPPPFLVLSIVGCFLYSKKTLAAASETVEALPS